jgi:hypothetical protein
MTERRSHESKGIYRTRAETAALREFILDRWAAGEGGGDIAVRSSITRDYVDAIVRRARAKGDPRAERRYSETDSYGWRRVVHGTFAERIWSMHQDGASLDEIAAATDRTTTEISSEISRQRLLRTGERRTHAEWVAQEKANAAARHEKYRAARVNGVRGSDIAQTFGVDRSTVYNALRA